MRQLLKNKLKEQKGFTLIELLAVIVILGIIAAIAIPAIGNVIESSKNKAKVAEAISIIDAARMAQTENVGTTTGSGATKVTTWTSTTASANALTEYVSKLQDYAWVVTYDHTTKKFSIAGHIAADVITTEATSGTLTEEELATASR